MPLKKFLLIVGKTFISEEVPPSAPATKNFFMDLYAKEVSKMQSVSKSSSATKKRNFDATQFNTYGLPLGKNYITYRVNHGHYIKCYLSTSCARMKKKFSILTNVLNKSKKKRDYFKRSHMF